MPKRKMPDSVRQYIKIVKKDHDVAIALVEAGIVHTDLREALERAGVSPVIIKALKQKSLQTRKSKNDLIEIIRGDFDRMLEHFSVEYDRASLLVLMAELLGP